MADGVYPLVFGHSKQLSLNKFFDPSTLSMRKGCDGGKKGRGGNGEKMGGKVEKNDENSGHYVIARTLTAGTPHACANSLNKRRKSE